MPGLSKAWPWGEGLDLAAISAAVGAVVLGNGAGGLLKSMGQRMYGWMVGAASPPPPAPRLGRAGRPSPPQEGREKPRAPMAVILGNGAGGLLKSMGSGDIGGDLAGEGDGDDSAPAALTSRDIVKGGHGADHN